MRRSSWHAIAPLCKTSIGIRVGFKITRMPRICRGILCNWLLAAAVALMARDKGEPFLSKQVLIYPVIDYHRHGQRSPYPSYEEKGSGFGLTSAGMGLYWQYYLKQESDGTHPYASPIRSADLTKLPMALIITAEFDTLCDEGERYAYMLGQAGVLVVNKRFDGMIHGFLNWQEDIVEKANAYNQSYCCFSSYIK